jgi:hypothetical protein
MVGLVLNENEQKDDPVHSVLPDLARENSPAERPPRN